MCPLTETKLFSSEEVEGFSKIHRYCAAVYISPIGKLLHIMTPHHTAKICECQEYKLAVVTNYSHQTSFPLVRRLHFRKGVWRLTLTNCCFQIILSWSSWNNNWENRPRINYSFHIPGNFYWHSTSDTTFNILLS